MTARRDLPRNESGYCQTPDCGHPYINHGRIEPGCVRVNCPCEAYTAPPLCPDGGTCHHRCDAHGRCWRVTGAGPLSGVFPGDAWPETIRSQHTDVHGVHPGRTAPPLPVTNRGGYVPMPAPVPDADAVWHDTIKPEYDRPGLTPDIVLYDEATRDPVDGPVTALFTSNPKARLQPTGQTAHGILRALQYAAFDQEPPAIDAPPADDIRQQHIGHLLVCVLAGVGSLDGKVDVTILVDRAVAALLWIGVTDDELQAALVYARARLRDIG